MRLSAKLRVSPFCAASSRQASPSGFPENARDLADSNPIDLGDLGNRHSVLHQSSDASELRPRDLGCRLLLGAAPRFDLLVTDRRHRGDSENARFARRLIGRRRRVRDRLLGGLPFRGEERLGRLARSRDPLAIIAGKVRLLSWVRHDLARTVYPFARSKPDSRILASRTWKAGGLCTQAQPPDA